ncbi:sugar kinase [Dongshaea marina]|uniref:sugar kinase n=1 Tax=Dongshaea marina TaxID=2047966 RepID=UPI000D3E042D|nr:sugar kinase [Dongshaea marina]
MTRVSLMGECMIELNGTPFAAMNQTFGGDSFNTALYLSRLAPDLEVEYVTALGEDAISDGMIERWQTEGIDTRSVLRDPQHQPGLYLIELDPQGERTFLYWRSDSAARYLLRHPEYPRVKQFMKSSDILYLSGISVAILPEDDRQQLLEDLEELSRSGVKLVFDSNYRPALWQDPAKARDCYQRLLSICSLALVTDDDEQLLWGDDDAQQIISRIHQQGCPQIILKQGAQGCIYSHQSEQQHIPTLEIANPVDTTAAGDSFNAGFLAGWAHGLSPAECCKKGHALAKEVINQRGAIIPPAKMQHLCPTQD